MVGGTELASSTGFKKFKMSNVVTIGSSGRPSAGAQWKSSSTQKIIGAADEDSCGPRIPLNRIKLSSAGSTRVTPNNQAASGRSGSRTGVTKLKIAGRRASTTRAIKVIDDPQVILN